jgi:hypothetical protein
VRLTEKHLELLAEIAPAGLSPDSVPYFYGDTFADLRRADLVVFWSASGPRPETMHGSGVSGRWFLTHRGAELVADEDAEKLHPVEIDVSVTGVTFPEPWYHRAHPG